MINGIVRNREVRSSESRHIRTKVTKSPGKWSVSGRIFFSDRPFRGSAGLCGPLRWVGKRVFVRQKKRNIPIFLYICMI